MKKKSTTILAFSVIICLIVNSVIDLVAAKTKSTISGTEDIVNEEVISGIEAKLQNEDGKLHFYFDKYEHTVIDDSEELKEAVAHTQEISTRSVGNTIVKVTVAFEADFESTEIRRSYHEKCEKAQTDEEYRKIKQELADFGLVYHREICDQNMPLLSAIKYEQVEYIDYTPCVVLYVKASELDEKVLDELAKNKAITSISVAQGKTEYVSDVAWNTTLQEIGAATIVQQGTYTGKLIWVGIYEAGGVCDVNHVNLSDHNIVVYNPPAPSPTPSISDHATAVTSIIALMAPESRLFVRKTDDSLGGLGWFIASLCDVVNCSFGVYNNIDNGNGTYTNGVKAYRNDIDGIYDYQINHYDIVCVKSAGNYCNDNTFSNYNPNNQITSPGYSYNAITVGGVKRVWSWFQYKLRHDEDASYVANLPYVKPEISAIFSVKIPNIPGTCSGTSFAAPQVTASIALLMQRSSSYTSTPQRVKAALMAAARTTDGYTEDRCHFDSHVGAGCINLEDTAYNSTNYVISVPAGHQSSSEVYSFYQYLNEGEEIDISAAWHLIKPQSNTDLGYLTDYDIRLYNDNISSYPRSNTRFSNVELLRYTAEVTGYYRIVVYQYDVMPSGNTAGDSISLTVNR